MKKINPISVAKNILVMIQFAVIMRYVKLALEFGEASFKLSANEYFKFIDTCRSITGKGELCEGVTSVTATLEDAKKAYMVVPKVDLDEYPSFRTEFIGAVWTKKDGSKTFLFHTLPEVDVTRRPIEMDAAHVLYEALAKHRPFSVEEANLLMLELLYGTDNGEIHFNHPVYLCHPSSGEHSRNAVTSFCTWFDGKVHLKKVDGTETRATFDQMPTWIQGLVMGHLLRLDIVKEHAGRLGAGYTDEEINASFKSLTTALNLGEHKRVRNRISTDEEWLENAANDLGSEKLHYVLRFLIANGFDHKPLKIEAGFDSPYMMHMLDSIKKGLALQHIKVLPCVDGEYCIQLSYKGKDGKIGSVDVCGPYENLPLIDRLYTFITDVEDHMPLYYEIIGETLMSTLE